MPTTTTRQQRVSTSAYSAPRRLARSKPVRHRRWLLFTSLKLAAIAALPTMFVRVAVDLLSRGHSTIVSVTGGAIVVLLALSVLVTSLAWRLTGHARFWSALRWIALPVVTLWCAFALFHLAQANAKTPEVRRAYTSLHPVLRLALSSAIIADGELVVTDAKRTADDYRRMRLPVFERTMHYPQRDSWVHAVDVRTIGHGVVRNLLLTGYFRVVGLRVVRHVGTADHLHVELPLRR